MRTASVLLVWLTIAGVASAAALDGRVMVEDGSPVPGATVTVTAGSTTRTVVTAPDGTFRLDVSPGSYHVTVTLPGFTEWRRDVTAAESSVPLMVTLRPGPLTVPLFVDVVATRGRINEPAAPISSISASELALMPSPSLDDALRQVPGFSLFRRTSSRTANPTTQGATLRGLAASGASRALVLADGVALNDPFGGWVYWNRVPQASIDRVEVVRGGASDVYGADALGGVVQVFTAQPDQARTQPVRLMIDGDTNATARSSLFGGLRRGSWTASGAGEASRTGGSFVVDDETRGAVDRHAGADYWTGRVSGGYDSGGWRVRGHAAAFGESRRNGTALQVNDTAWRQGSADAAGPVGRGFLELQGAAGDQTYHQTFTAIAADRSTETLTSRQAVPTTAASGSVVYRLPIGTSDLLAGVDTREVWATNKDVSFLPSGAIRSTTTTPGYDRAAGVYAQFRATLGARGSVTAGVRNDWWNREASGPSTSVFSPRIAASFRLTPLVVVRGSFGRAFRAPTINERIRPFRAGNTLTLANADLDPERLTLGEGGLLVEGAKGSILTSMFTSVVDDAVTNVTLSTTPQLITRQRRNAAGVRASGVESEGEWRWSPSLSLTGSLALTHSTYQDTPDLSGNDVPQVPRWQTTVGARWLAPWKLTVQGLVRGLGEQFEDDRNTLVLRQATLVDVVASRGMGPRASVFVAAENLFDVDYDTGRTPTRTIGTPFTFRVAVRYSY